MRAIEIGRRLIQLGQTEDAVRAYTLALEKESGDLLPLEKMEAAVFLLDSGGDYRTAYDAFVSLYGEESLPEEALREDAFSILQGAFYEPNRKELQSRYEKNVKSLRKYRWIFRKDFPDFDSLPLRFFPYDDHTWFPFDTRTRAFLPKFIPRREEITRHFFRDLENPVLASDVFSQYEMEYLNDNLRRSEDVGRDNHVYLHYTEWEVFCSYLQVWNLNSILKAEKIVFLFGGELSLYPLDFKTRFGIDYSQFPVRPVGIREVNKLIWHTQLSAHNGGDFFNEIFDDHPNLLFLTSILFSGMKDEVDALREALRVTRNLKDLQEKLLDHWENPRLVQELYQMRSPTDKDLMVALYLGHNKHRLDPASRIVPALFFQPHFENVRYGLTINQDGDTVISSKQVNELHKSTLFRDFKYVKTFTPVRRFTTSYGGSLRFALRVGYQTDIEAERKRAEEDTENGTPRGVRLLTFNDILGDRVRNRSFMVDPEDRLFRDSILVRLEDGKLNPAATFTRLAAFLDIPYTETMTYCSDHGKHDPPPLLAVENEHYSRGFNPKSVYATYDEYAGRYEKLYIEYLLRDAYEYFGYDFQCYDGSPVDEETIRDWIDHFDAQERAIRKSQALFFQEFNEHNEDRTYQDEAEQEKFIQSRLKILRDTEEQTALALTAGLRYVNENGIPLRMGRLLEPDPELLAQPLYH